MIHTENSAELISLTLAVEPMRTKKTMHSTPIGIKELLSKEVVYEN